MHEFALPPREPRIEDLLAMPDEQRFHEFYDGELVRRATPSGEHGDAQAAVTTHLRQAFHKRSGSDGKGGWWILTEVEVALGSGVIVRPDVVGWRRENAPERPSGFPVQLRPDWVCEIVSEAKPSVDTVKKARIYHRAGIPHYWLVDPRDASLRVLRWDPAGYVQVLGAERGETVEPEPFQSVKLEVGVLFGDDPADEDESK